MRLLLASTEYAPMKAGVANLVTALHDALAEAHEVFLFVPPGSEVSDPDRASLELARPGPGPKAWLSHARNARAVSDLVDRWRIDRVLWMDPVARAASLPGAPEIPSLVYVHGTEVVPGARLGELQSGRFLLQQRAMRRADAVVANSNATAALVRSACPDLTPAVVYPCFDPSRAFDPARHGEDPYAPAEGRSRPFIFLTVSRLVDRKGHDQVLRILARAQAQLPDFQYVIAGEGPARADIETRAQALGISDRVRFVGAVSDAELGAYYGYADLFVMLSKRTDSGIEGFGLTYIEAGASGTAVVGANHGGAVEAVRHGETGLIVDPAREADAADALVALAGDAERRAAYGEAGRAWAAQLVPKVIAEQLLRCLP
jgi:glycosyltransferase involved in cell wall biosynthesis